MIPDAEKLIKEWLAEQTEIMAITDGRHYWTLPEKDKPHLPALAFVRVGGEIEDQHDYPRMSFSCWGKDKAEAGRLAYVVASVLDIATDMPPLTLDSGMVKAVYDVIAPMQIAGVSWAKAYRVQASFVTCAA